MIDWTKPIRTRKGRAARYVTELDTKEEHSKVVAIRNESGEEYITLYPENGVYWSEVRGSQFDLENVPEQTSYYLNVYKDGSSVDHYSMEDAAKGRTSRHTDTKFGGTLHLTFEGNHLVGVEKIDD